MGKYLIQDIIPPEKKHRAGSKKSDAPSHTALHKTAHPDARGVSHAADHPAHHKVHTEEQDEELVAPEKITQDPHTMIADQLESEHRVPEIHEKPTPHGTESGPSPELPSGTWPYTHHNTSPSSEAAPSFKQNISEQFPSYTIGGNQSGGKWLPWILGPLVILGIIALTLNFFSGATVSVVPKSETMPMDQKFSAFKNSSNNALSYAVMKVEESDTLEIPATGSKTVTTKAAGKIIIFNEQTTAQRLIKNTRFESTAGKIYRINESVTVPKQKSASTPGSLEVTVYADEAGKEYNSEPTDFTIPGLKNTPQAKKVYARSKGAIVGGASGTTKSVSDQDLERADNDLHVTLETKLRNKARANLSPSQIAYDQGIIIDFKDPTLSEQKASSEDKVIVTETGTLYMVVFDKDALTQVIAKAAVPTYGGEEITLNNIQTLQFSMDQEESGALWGSQSLDFSLKGSPELKWIVDEAAIKKDLLGLSKAEFNAKMAQYPTIERAQASIRPFWKQSFPNNPEAISVKIIEKITD